MIHQVAEGMKYLHSLTPALIHKDLKADNVLLDKYLNVKVSVFVGGFPSPLLENICTSSRRLSQS